MGLRSLCALLGCLFAGAALGQPESARDAASQVALAGREIHLRGAITPAAVDEVARLLGSPAGRRADLFKIDSTGGDGEAAIRLGTLIHQRGLAVQVQRVCATICAFYIAPAARRLVVPPGALLVMTQMPSPQLLAMLEAQLRYPGLPDAERARLNEAAPVLRRLVAAQDGYYRMLGADPSRAYLTMDVLRHIVRQVQAAGRPVRALGFVPDALFLRQCFDIQALEMPTFTAEDSRRLAHAGASPVAFLIGGEPYFEGDRLSPLSVSCAPRS